MQMPEEAKVQEGRVWKRGALSADELAYVLESASQFTPEQIGDKLNRKPELVRKTIAKHGLDPTQGYKDHKVQMPKAEVQARMDLRSGQKWKSLKKIYTSEELEYFEEEYMKLYSQFNGDVLPSEETQLFQYISYELLMRRNLLSRKRALEEAAEYEALLDGFYKEHGKSKRDYDDEVREEYDELVGTLENARRDEKSQAVEYTKYQERADALSKALRSNRDQRVKENSSGQDTILGLFKRLQQREFRTTEGRQMELMRMAAEAQYSKLGELHQYEDGQWDRPILSADTVDIGVAVEPPEGQNDSD